MLGSQSGYMNWRRTPVPDRDPILEAFRDLRRQVTILIIATVMLYAGLAGVLIGAYIIRSNDQVERTKENRQAIRFLCTVTEEFDSAIVSARDQIRANFESGVYDKALAEGRITQENYDQARVTMEAYDRTHLRLQEDLPCLQVR